MVLPKIHVQTPVDLVLDLPVIPDGSIAKFSNVRVVTGNGRDEKASLRLPINSILLESTCSHRVKDGVAINQPILERAFVRKIVHGKSNYRPFLDPAMPKFNPGALPILLWAAGAIGSFLTGCNLMGYG